MIPHCTSKRRASTDRRLHDLLFSSSFILCDTNRSEFIITHHLQVQSFTSFELTVRLKTCAIEHSPLVLNLEHSDVHTSG